MYADLLRERKKKAELTTAELAEQSGVPTGTINKLLTGETKSPRYDTMKALDEVLRKYEYAVEANLMVREEAIAYSAQNRNHTVDDYYKLPDEIKVELIDGVFYNMSSPSSVHQMTLINLLVQSKNFIDQKKGNCIPFVAPMDVQLDCDEYTMVQPDFFIVCNPDMIQNNKIYGAPDFVAEVLSPSSKERDYIRKLNKYMMAGVKEYWIVDLERERIAVYFAREDYLPTIYPLHSEVPVRIYDGELKILL